MRTRLVDPLPTRWTVIGLDLSPTATGVVVLRPEWEPGNWGRTLNGIDLPSMHWHVFTDTEQKGFDRAYTIAEQVAHVVMQEQTALIPSFGKVAVFIEDFAKGMVFRAHDQGELAGTVKCFLRRDGVPHRVVGSSQWRKLLVGKGSGKGIKKHVIDRLVEAGAPWRKSQDDIFDAFGVCNWGRSELGLPALTLV